MMLVTVIGIERPAVFRYPSGAECDVCHKVVNWPTKEAVQQIAALRADGWKIDGNGIGAACVCPDHLGT